MMGESDSLRALGGLPQFGTGAVAMKMKVCFYHLSMIELYCSNMNGVWIRSKVFINYGYI